jgi:hypothetical protein
MLGPSMLKRRELLRLIGTLPGLALVAGRIQATSIPRLDVNTVLGAIEPALPCPLARTYRADAVVTLLGLAVFVRRGAGAAFAAVREAAQEERRLIALHFAGRSDPGRTHGILYDGSLEELIVECDSTPARAAYFGFVTSSKDESYEQAKKRVLSSRKGTSASYVAVEGLHITGRARCEKAAVGVDDPRRLELAELTERVRQRFSGADRQVTELSTRGNSAAPTFLWSILAALRSTDARSQFHYVHDARDYRLEWDRTSDPRTGAVLAANRLTTQPDAVMQFTCRLSCFATRQASTFRLWKDNQSVLPLRIEYQARSYLRINLEYEPAEAQPNQKCTEET